MNYKNDYAEYLSTINFDYFLTIRRKIKYGNITYPISKKSLQGIIKKLYKELINIDVLFYCIEKDSVPESYHSHILIKLKEKIITNGGMDLNIISKMKLELEFERLGKTYDVNYSIIKSSEASSTYTIKDLRSDDIDGYDILTRTPPINYKTKLLSEFSNHCYTCCNTELRPLIHKLKEADSLVGYEKWKFEDKNLKEVSDYLLSKKKDELLECHNLVLTVLNGKEYIEYYGSKRSVKTDLIDNKKDTILVSLVNMLYRDRMIGIAIYDYFMERKLAS